MSAADILNTPKTLSLIQLAQIVTCPVQLLNCESLLAITSLGCSDHAILSDGVEVNFRLHSVSRRSAQVKYLCGGTRFVSYVRPVSFASHKEIAYLWDR
jgi:hypothetical protein